MLEPFGNGNAEPVFRLRGVLVVGVGRMGGDGKHLRLGVRGGDGKVMKLVGFFARDEWFEVEEGERVDVLVNVLVNEWNGNRAVEGRLLQVERNYLD